jgi:hypothetical protein
MLMRRSRIRSIRCWRTASGKFFHVSRWGISRQKPCGPARLRGGQLL